MKPLTLEEFAQELRRKGDWREGDFADEILALLDLETEVAEPYGDLLADLEIYAPVEMSPDKAMEWLGDRSNLLSDIEKQIEDANRKPAGTVDVSGVVKELLGTMEHAEAILEAAGWPGGDFLDALQGLAERAARAPEEVEIVTYDL